MKTKPPSRAELVERIARKQGITKKSAGEMFDQVLDVVSKMATPYLENDWTGGEVLAQLRRWRAK